MWKVSPLNIHALNKKKHICTITSLPKTKALTKANIFRSFEFWGEVQYSTSTTLEARKRRDFPKEAKKLCAVFN